MEPGVDAESFAELYGAQYPRVFRYLLRRLRDSRAAEEVAAEVFATALASLQKGTQPGHAGSWLIGIADHLASRHWRQTRTEAVRAGALLPPEEEDPEELAIRRLEGQALWRCVDALSPEHRQVLLLRIVAGRTAHEVGEIMNRTDEAVRSLQFRALSALRQLWKEASAGAGAPHAADR